LRLLTSDKPTANFSCTYNPIPKANFFLKNLDYISVS